MLVKYLVPAVALCLYSCSSRHSTATEEVPVCDNITGSGQLTGLLGLPAEKLSVTTGLYSLEDGGKSLVARAWLCDHAAKTLDIQYYIFSKDNTGLIACDFIVRAADRGVKVRLIIDDITVKPNSREIGLLDSHPNIEIKVYNPGVKLGKLSERIKKIAANAGKLHRRMHTKTIIADGQAAITGGRNIADEYFDYDRKYNFRDRDVLLFGKEVKNVELCFEDFWKHPLSVAYSELANENKKKFRDPRRFDRLHIYACDTAHFSNKMREQIRNYPTYFKSLQSSGEFDWVENAFFVFDPPGKNEDRPDNKGCVTLDSLVALIKRAKKSVVIQSPYLILTDEGKTLFRETVGRGVKVKVLTNSLGATDNYEAFSGYQRDREAVLATGIDVFEFKPDAAGAVQAYDS
jgi:putative cardiolipin synthase